MTFDTQIQDLIQNYQNRTLRVSPDWNVVALGNLQIENLDWRWVFEDGQAMSVLLYNPFDCRFKYLPKGNFEVTKYGLSNKVSIDTYKPLWKLGTSDKVQASIMQSEMQKMQKNGPRKSQNGIEIIPGSPLWNTVDTLATKARNGFKIQLAKKLQDLNAQGEKVDGEKLWNAGVPVCADVIGVLRRLGIQLSK